MNNDDRPTTNDPPQGPFTYFEKILYGNNSATVWFRSVLTFAASDEHGWMEV